MSELVKICADPPWSSEATTPALDLPPASICLTIIVSWYEASLLVYQRLCVITQKKEKKKKKVMFPDGCDSLDGQDCQHLWSAPLWFSEKVSGRKYARWWKRGVYQVMGIRMNQENKETKSMRSTNRIATARHGRFQKHSRSFAEGIDYGSMLTRLTCGKGHVRTTNLKRNHILTWEYTYWHASAWAN